MYLSIHMSVYLSELTSIFPLFFRITLARDFFFFFFFSVFLILKTNHGRKRPQKKEQNSHPHTPPRTPRNTAGRELGVGSWKVVPVGEKKTPRGALRSGTARAARDVSGMRSGAARVTSPGRVLAFLGKSSSTWRLTREAPTSRCQCCYHSPLCEGCLSRSPPRSFVFWGFLLGPVVYTYPSSLSGETVSAFGI